MYKSICIEQHAQHQLSTLNQYYCSGSYHQHIYVVIVQLITKQTSPEAPSIGCLNDDVMAPINNQENKIPTNISTHASPKNNPGPFHISMACKDGWLCCLCF